MEGKHLTRALFRSPLEFVVRGKESNRTLSDKIGINELKARNIH